MFEGKININQVVELRCKTTDYLGVGAVKKMDDIAKDLRARGIERVLVVTGSRAYKVSGAWDYVRPALEENSLRHELFDSVSANPTVQVIDRASARARAFDAQAIVAIGGGSPIDAAKSVAILARYPDRTATDLYMHAFAATEALPLVAINLTHGTGTETNRFAVATIPDRQFKSAIGFDCIYPLWAIDDPALTTRLPADQTRWVTIDALNHVTETATTVVTSPYAIHLARETVRLISDWLPRALKDHNDLTARYFLHYASAIGGMAFDNGLLHYTHALEHPLSAVKPEIAHGLGLAVLLPAVLKTIYPYTPEVLAEIYAPIVSGLTGVPAEADEIAARVEQWLFDMGVTQKLGDLGFTHGDVDRLEALVHETPFLPVLLSLSPVPESLRNQAVRSIFEQSFERLA